METTPQPPVKPKTLFRVLLPLLTALAALLSYLYPENPLVTAAVNFLAILPSM